MKNFTYYAPTEIAFGPDSEKRLVELIRSHHMGSSVLVVYGGRHAERSGLIDKFTRMLADSGISVTLHGGVHPNPRLSHVRAGIDKCHQSDITAILAIGGGSVIDASKAIAYGARYDGDVWDFYAGRTDATDALPVGVVLTIPAAGSEMSNSSVITNDEQGGLKVGYNNNLSRPRFAILNPELTYSLPPYQTACGITDMMMHTFERYFARDNDQPLTDALAEALLRTVVEYGPVAVNNPQDYQARATLMWAASLAHNDLTGDRTGGDWASHKIEHELSGLFDVAHGAGLAAVWPVWARYVADAAPARFERFAVNVMGISPGPDAAMRGIEAMSRFMQSIGMPATIAELVGHRPTPAEIDLMADRCTHGGTLTVGCVKPLSKADVAAILGA